MPNVIEVEGLKEALKELNTIDKKLRREITRDFKKIVQLYCSSEELEQYDELTDDVYEKLANEKQSVLNGKIFWGYIDICRSECNTLDGDSDGED